MWSFVHIEDAAEATVAAIERGGAGIYNIVDDEPAPVAEWLPGGRGARSAPSRRGASRGWSAGCSPARPRRS